MDLAPVVPGKTRLGWIGTGVMGRSMCGHLIDRGFAMTVFSRTKPKAESLLAKGSKMGGFPGRCRRTIGRGVQHCRFPSRCA